MAKKYLDYDGLLYFWQKIKTLFAAAGHNHSGTYLDDVAYDSTNTKITKTKGGTTSDVTKVVTEIKGNSESTYRSGQVNLTPANIGAAASSHAHGNITSAGALQSTDVAIANGDKLVVTDASNSNKVARTSVAFDGSTATQALTKAGTFVDFPTYTHPSYTSAAAAAVKVGRDTTGHVVIGSALAKGDVGLGNVDNTSDANKPISTATQAALDEKVDAEEGKGLSTEDYTTAEKTKLAGIAAGAQVNTVTGVKGSAETSYRTGNINLTAANVGAIATSAKGAANGVCPLNSSSKIDATYLPSYVDDVIEAYPLSSATELSSGWLSLTASGSALTPETGKIYVLMADSTNYSANTQFRWGGTAYVKLADGGVSSITNGEIDTIVAS